MNATDQLKVIRAGFTIIRTELSTLKIKFKDRNNHDWKTLESGFPSKAALLRTKKEFLKQNLFIED